MASHGLGPVLDNEAYRLNPENMAISTGTLTGAAFELDATTGGLEIDSRTAGNPIAFGSNTASPVYAYGGIAVNPAAVVADTADVAVTEARSGSAYIADTTAGNITYTMPATADMVGRRFMFIKGAAGNNMIITASGAHIYGAVQANDVDTEGAPSTTGTFTAGAVGDYLELIYVNATTILARGQAAGATFAWS